MRPLRGHQELKIEKKQFPRKGQNMKRRKAFLGIRRQGKGERSKRGTTTEQVKVRRSTIT